MATGNSLTKPTAWPGRRKLLVSLLLAFHLTAVVVAPWSAVPPTSQLAVGVRRVFNWYLNLAYLNHGYRFFAPDPGPSHLVRYEVELEQGRLEYGRFPSLTDQWPRLLYHRYFMISEAVFNLTEPVREKPERFNDDQHRKDFEAQRRLSRELVRSLARDIARRHEGVRNVKLFLQEHAIPFPQQVENGMSLDDESLYEERPLGEFRGEEL